MSPRRPYLIAAAVLAAAVLAALGLFGGYLLSDDADPPTLPANDSVDAGFARAMQVHHAQAVEMSFMVRDMTDDERVRMLAYDIATTQQQQIGQMFGWLGVWGLPQHSSAPLMAWMDNNMGGHDMAGMGQDESSLMPGIATQPEMDQLDAARGRQAEILFLQMMIRHHQGGVAMARYAQANAETDHVRGIAETMVIAQEAEIDAMNDMLVERGANPIR